MSSSPGPGPNGLMLACELSLAGVRPVRPGAAAGAAAEPRANGLVGQVVRVLDRPRPVRADHRRARNPRRPPGFMFGGDAPGPDRRWTTTRSTSCRCRSAASTQMLRGARGRARGGDPPRPRADRPGPGRRRRSPSTVAGPDGALPARAPATWSARDGGHSVTRKRAGIGFPGVTRDDAVSRTANASAARGAGRPGDRRADVPRGGPIPPFMHPPHRDRRCSSYAPFPEPGVHARHHVEWTGGAGRRAAPMTPGRSCARASQRVLGVDLPIDPARGRRPAPAAPPDRPQHPAGRPVPRPAGAAGRRRRARPLGDRRPRAQPRPAGRRRTSAGSSPPRSTAGHRPGCSTPTRANGAPGRRTGHHAHPGAVRADRARRATSPRCASCSANCSPTPATCGTSPN